MSSFIKCFNSLLLLLAAVTVFTACKKEEREPPFNAASLSSGRAAIKFTTSKAIAGSTEFNINNTPSTVATNQPLSGTTVRNVVLEATELYNNAPTRKAIISMAVRPNSTEPINLARTSGLPLGFIHIESFAFLGYTRRSQSGTITITRFTATEIEGAFTASFDDGTVIENGKFAGSF